MFLPRQLALWSAGRWNSQPNGAIAGFSHDTRAVKPGQCFVAIKAGRDGHDFLPTALAAGASCALVSREVTGIPLPQLIVEDTLAAFHRMAKAWRRSFSHPVISITGSCGKTSTKDLLSLLLGNAAAVHRTAGNFNNHLGVPLTLLSCDPASTRFSVVEAGTSAPGEIPTLASVIEPDAAIVTTVAEAHLDGLVSLHGVAAEKSALLHGVRPGGFAVCPDALPALYPVFRGLRVTLDTAAPAASTNFFSPRCHRWISVPDTSGTNYLQITEPSGLVARFTVPRVSPGQLSNAVLAIITARRLGVTDVDIAARLSAWSPSARRGEVVTHDGNTYYIDCYNANPASLADSLHQFQASTPETSPRLYVIGCMNELGSDAVALHHTAGSRLRLRPADQVCVIGREASAFAEGLLSSGASPAQVHTDSAASTFASVVTSFTGSIFLKGSRSYELEQLLPAALAGAAH